MREQRTDAVRNIFEFIEAKNLTTGSAAVPGNTHSTETAAYEVKFDRPSKEKQKSDNMDTREATIDPAI